MIRDSDAPHLATTWYHMMQEFVTSQEMKIQDVEVYM